MLGTSQGQIEEILSWLTRVGKECEEWVLRTKKQQRRVS